MEQQISEIMILDEGQALPEEITTPPRIGQWYDTFSYIGNPEQFCAQNLAKYGAIFNTSVFGSKTIFVGASQANKMVFNGDSKYTEIALPDTTMDMFGEYSLYEFIPFGGGVHACLGIQMAMVITKIFANHAISLFDWQLTGEASFVQFPLKKIKNNYQINLQPV